MDCICDFIVQNARQILVSLRNANGQSFCDESDCYEQSPFQQPSGGNANMLPMLIGFLVVLYLIMTLLNRGNRRSATQKVSGGGDNGPNDDFSLY